TLGENFPLQELQLADLQRHVTARRKKKYRGQPLSPVTLKKEMASFRQAGVVGRSRKRSRTTGHRGEKTRESSLRGRMATVRKRGEQEAAAVTRDEAHDHLKRTLAGSKWQALKGYHVLRHSFISCLAADGVDQRVIDDFVG